MSTPTHDTKTLTINLLAWLWLSLAFVTDAWGLPLSTSGWLALSNLRFSSSNLHFETFIHSLLCCC